MNSMLVLAGLSLSLFTYTVQGADARADIDASGKGYRGVVMLNQAAGELQQQVNTRVITDGRPPTIQVEQKNSLLNSASASDFSAYIQAESFRGGSGVLGVNQGAGLGNQQINNFQLGTRVLPSSLDDSSLAQSAAPLSTISAVEPLERGQRLVEIDDQAFSGSSGVVQLNQGAGVGNRMINSLGIQIVE